MVKNELWVFDHAVEWHLQMLREEEEEEEGAGELKHGWFIFVRNKTIKSYSPQKLRVWFAKKAIGKVLLQQDSKHLYNSYFHTRCLGIGVAAGLLQMEC